MAKPKEHEPITKQDYEKLGRELESILTSGYIDHKRLYKVSFLRGLFIGFGTVIGGTLLIAFMIWLLSFFDQIPLVGEITETVQQALEEKP